MLARTALRLAAIEALAPAAAVASGAPLPTIAGPRVYDSRQQPLDAVDEIEGLPILIVYTENQEFLPYGTGTTRPDNTTVTLIIEIMIAAKALVTIAMPDGSTQDVGTLDTPIMEGPQEALLDLLEATVRRRLDGVFDVDAQTQLFRKVCGGFKHVHSIPARDDTRTVRFAARTLTFEAKVVMDQWPAPSLSPSSPTGFDALPEPLKSVAKALPSSSPGFAICTLLAGAIVRPAALTPLSTISIGMDEDRTAKQTPTDITAAANF